MFIGVGTIWGEGENLITKRIASNREKELAPLFTGGSGGKEKDWQCTRRTKRKER